MNAPLHPVFITFSPSVILVHFSKFGVPIKTTVSATVLKEALHGAVSIHPLQLGQPISTRVQYFLISISFGLCNSRLSFINFMLASSDRLRSNVLIFIQLHCRKKKHMMGLFAMFNHQTKASSRLGVWSLYKHCN